MLTAKEIADQIITCFKKGNKVLVFGNGGSLADASHWAAEFHGIGSVIALNDPAKITSIANDINFERVFEIQIRDLGKEEDLVIGISSSGRSRNVNWALDTALYNGLHVIDWPRKGKTTAEIQQYQYQLLHKVYLLVKQAFS